jgi:glutamine cyclotransferase
MSLLRLPVTPGYCSDSPFNPALAVRSTLSLPASFPRFAPRDTYKVVGVYPHDPGAFTQGLLFDGGFLYESTGLVGRSTLRKVRLETGEVLKSIDLASQYWGEGLTLWKEQLIQLTWRSNVRLVYDKESFRKLGSFSYPTEGWGITHDDSSLIMSDGTSTLRFLDPHSFQEGKRLEVHDHGMPIVNLNELEFVKEEILANVWTTDFVARISPASGEVVGWIDLSGLRDELRRGRHTVDVLNGIAYDGADNRIFVTGKFWPKLFWIEIQPAP